MQINNNHIRGAGHIIEGLVSTVVATAFITALVAAILKKYVASLAVKAVAKQVFIYSAYTAIGSSGILIGGFAINRFQIAVQTCKNKDLKLDNTYLYDEEAASDDEKI